MRAAGPTTGAAFAGLEILNRALNSAIARRFLFCRNDPTDPFVPRERRQIFPGCLRRRIRGERLGQVSRSFM
jgi:hypothetical protein